MKLETKFAYQRRHDRSLVILFPCCCFTNSGKRHNALIFRGSRNNRPRRTDGGQRFRPEMTLLEGREVPAVVPIFHTGAGADGLALTAATAIDPHFTVTNGTRTEPAKAIVDDNFPIDPRWWLANDADSRWIAPNWANADGSAAPGVYTFTTTFDLTGYDPTTAVLKGKWAADNQGLNILINGVPLGLTHGGPNPGNGVRGFGSYSEFTIASGFVSGVNKLEFVIQNDRYSATNGASNPTGLRVDDMVLTANANERTLTPSLRAVTYGGPDRFDVEADPGESPYAASSPHWLDSNGDGLIGQGDQAIPVGYVRNAIVTVSSTIDLGMSLAGIRPTDLRVRGDGPGTYDVAARFQLSMAIRSSRHHS